MNLYSLIVTTQVEWQSCQEVIKNNFRAKAQRKNEQYNMDEKQISMKAVEKGLPVHLRSNGL